MNSGPSLSTFSESGKLVLKPGLIRLRHLLPWEKESGNYFYWWEGKQDPKNSEADAPVKNLIE